MRPTTLHVGGTLYWVLRTYMPSTGGALVDADSTPTVAVRKNGSAVGDSVTVTKRSATTGIYDCSYNPAGEIEGDKFTIEETAVISSTTYSHNFEVLVVAVERGTDSALTSLDAVWERLTSALTTAGSIGKLIVDALGGGSGPYTVTITVTDDDAVPIQGAIVRLSKTGEAKNATTNASGVATFGVTAATWSVAITAGGAYTFTTTTLVVSADTSQTYALTDNAPSPPAAPLLSTGYLDCYGTDGAAEAGVEIEIVLKTGPGTAGYGLDTGTATATSAANGRASHSGFLRGATYKARRGATGQWVTFTVPNASTFQLPEVLGQP